MGTHSGCERDTGDAAVPMGPPEVVDKHNKTLGGIIIRHNPLHPLSETRQSQWLLQPAPELQPTPTLTYLYLATPYTLNYP